MGLLSLKTSRIILGAAVIDDVLGLLVLAVVSSMAGGAIDYAEIGITAALSIGFIVAVAAIGAPAMKRIAPTIIGLRIGQRSEERRVGKEGVSTCRSRGSRYN